MPKEIEQSEFTNLKTEISSLKIDSSHDGSVKIADLLDFCYELDMNAIPPVYSLKEIQNHFKDEVSKRKVFDEDSLSLVLNPNFQSCVYRKVVVFQKIFLKDNS
jgi:hypothetical protein